MEGGGGDERNRRTIGRTNERKKFKCKHIATIYIYIPERKTHLSPPSARLPLTVMPDEPRNSWENPMTFGIDQNVSARELSGEESFWLRLLAMLAAVFPVISKRTLEASHLRWAVFPAVWMLVAITLVIIKIIHSVEELQDIAAFKNGTTAQLNEKKALLGSHIWVLSMAVIGFAGPVSLSLSRKQFVDNFPKKLLHWFGAKAKTMCIGCISLFVVVPIALICAISQSSNLYKTENFVIFTVAAVWLSAFVCVLCMRSYVFTKAHSLEYKEMRKFAHEDSVANLAVRMMKAKKETMRWTKAYLQGPLVVTIFFIFLSLLPGAYLLFRSTGTSMEPIGPFIGIFMFFEILTLLEPIRALAKISQRAEELELIIGMNEHLGTVEAGALLVRFPLIFPYVMLYDVPVTKGSITAVILAAAAPLAGKIVSSLAEVL